VLSEVTAMILAGGLGTRLRPVVADLPKVMAPVVGKPFLTRLLDQIASAGIRKVVLCTGYRADLVEKILGSAYGPLQLIYSAEETPLGTAGALALAAHSSGAINILAMNGDSYCHADLPALWRFHQEHRAVATLQLAQVSDTSRFGRVQLDADDRITRFDEKSSAIGPGLINAGIYCLSAQALANVAPNQSVSLEREIFPALIGHDLFGYSHGGKFLDIGTPDSYQQAEAFFGDSIERPA